jgi:hypothetical protein
MRTAVLLLLLSLWSASAAITATNVYTYQATGGGTSNSTVIALGTVNITPHTLLVQNGGLATTNALTVEAQYSFDGTNFATLATYQPSATNAAVGSYTPSLGAKTVYFRARITTTNSVNVGIISASQ